MPSITYRRLADAAAWAGLTPHFADVDPATLALSSDTVADLINDRTALLLGVHPIVNCCDATGLEALSSAAGIPLLMDSVESSFEIFDGRRVGTFGRCELFSLHASKLLNGFEGGYIATNDSELADLLALTRAFGFRLQDQTDHFGVNAKLNEVHAAMALASLDGVAEQVDRNRRLYERYVELLAADLRLTAARIRSFPKAWMQEHCFTARGRLASWSCPDSRTSQCRRRIGACVLFATPAHKAHVLPDDYEVVARDRGHRRPTSRAPLWLSGQHRGRRGHLLRVVPDRIAWR